MRNSRERVVLSADENTGLHDRLRGPVAPRAVTEAVAKLLPADEPAPVGSENIVSDSEAMKRVMHLARRFARTDVTVLITGETGTGKELIASSIHRHSKRAAGPLVCVNCAAIPDSLVESELFGFQRGAFTGAFGSQQGKFHSAEGGTLFLDEIGDMSAAAQAKILRVLESREVHPLGAAKTIPIDVRVIAATHQDLEKSVAENRFRADLFFRLSVARVHVPALRERPEDISPLAHYILADLNSKHNKRCSGFTQEALCFLIQHPWPRNVRQLRNAIESAFILSNTDQITASDIQRSTGVKSPVVATPPRGPIVDERERLLEALRTANWNKSKAAEALRCSRSSVYRLIDRHALSPGATSPGVSPPLEGGHREQIYDSTRLQRRHPAPSNVVKWTP
jgi:transcriptional regulator with PAS, ATPase and Fis domain